MGVITAVGSNLVIGSDDDAPFISPSRHMIRASKGKKTKEEETICHYLTFSFLLRHEEKNSDFRVKSIEFKRSPFLLLGPARSACQDNTYRRLT